MYKLLYLSVALATCGSSAAFATDPPITAVAFAPEGESVVAVSQSGVHVFSWPELKRQKVIDTAASNQHCLVFSPNGQHVAVGGGNPSEEGIAEIFSWPAGKSVTTLNEHDDSVLAIAWRDESRLLTTSIDRSIKVWDLQEKDMSLATYRGHSRNVSDLCLLRDGKTLVSAGDDHSVRVWDLGSGELTRTLNQHTAPIHTLAPRPTQNGLPMVASAAGDRTIRLWQPTIGRMVRYVRLEVEPLDIAWLNDGSHILAACVDGCVRVVNADEVRVTEKLVAIDGWAYAIAVHPSGDSVVVGGSDGQLRSLRVAR